jgi:hypothetical protein
MNTREEADLTTKVLAVLGSLALGFTALINAIFGTMALLSGHLAGAIGDASEKTKFDSNLTTDAHHFALAAKLVALGFGLLALVEFGAGEFLRRRIRNLVVPIACGMTIVGEAALSIWAKHFTSLDAIMVLCAVFAAWTWYRLPRATPYNPHDARLGGFAPRAY